MEKLSNLLLSGDYWSKIWFLSRSAHRTPNFSNSEYFDNLFFEYCFMIKVLNWYRNTSKNISLHTKKKKKTLCQALNWGNWNFGFVKLGVRWTERDISLEFLPLWTPISIIWIKYPNSWVKRIYRTTPNETRHSGLKILVLYGQGK